MTSQAHNDAVENEIVAWMTELFKQRNPVISNLDKHTALDAIGLDSFDMIEFIFSVEDKYGIEIPFSVGTTEPTYKTVGDLIEKVIELVKLKRGGDGKI